MGRRQPADLGVAVALAAAPADDPAAERGHGQQQEEPEPLGDEVHVRSRRCGVVRMPRHAVRARAAAAVAAAPPPRRRAPGRRRWRRPARSEEPTSGLQSLMSISYAVFRLKTNNKQTTGLRELT